MIAADELNTIMTKPLYYIREDKSTVQDYYVGVIAQACQRLGYDVCKSITLEELHSVPKHALLIAISHYTVCKIYLKGYRKIFYWIQGSSPDESFMRNHSLTRKFVISVIERLAISFSTFLFMVSKSMLSHFEKKYHCSFAKKTYIMPCYNSIMQSDLFFTPGKYENNVFCYVGGLSVWQCFPETVDIYKKAEDVIPNAFLKVFTGDIEKAKSILKTKGVKNYSVEFVVPDQLVSKLADCKYGFIIRQESPVNYVATPTKLSNYMAAGLIPIVTDTVGFFSESLSQIKYSVILDSNSIDSIIKISSLRIKPSAVLADFSKVFDTFYNTERHVKQIGEVIKEYL